MSQSVMKVTAVVTEAPDQPGVSAQMAAVLRERGIGLRAVWAWPAGGGMTTVVSIPEDIAALRTLAAEEGRTTQEVSLAWLEGPDEVGALCDFLAKVGQAGINIVSLHALAVGGRFAAAFRFESEQQLDQVVALTGG